MAARKAPEDALTRYREKRNFSRTPEPQGAVEAADGALRFVIHKHWATRLHYDLRLEWGGTMRSWAVPKGPSLDPHDKRMAVEVEDHPISYNHFEGQIPAGQYGAGRVIVWERGTWVPESDAGQGFEEGHVKFTLHGEKLQGRWALVRMKGPRANPKKPVWLLIKEKDDAARPAGDFDVTQALPDSVNAQAMPASARPLAKRTSATAKKEGGSAGAPIAKRTALPSSLAPQLAVLANDAPHDPKHWRYELKFDGYRLLARIDARGAVRLFTRAGNDWTAKLQGVQDAVAALGLRSTWLDGELIAYGDNGAPDFQRLQNAFDHPRRRRENNAPAAQGAGRLAYTVFDLPFSEGQDLRDLPLQERRSQLEGLLEGAAPDEAGHDDSDDHQTVRFSAAFDANPRDLVSSACKMGFEGVIGKRQDAPYRSGRSSDWIKLKCARRQEFVVVGFTDPQGSRAGLGALLLAVHDDTGALVYAGKVGTGFNDAGLLKLREALRSLQQARCPLDHAPPGTSGAHWLQPSLVAEVAFAEWTQGGHVRHAVFKGLRSDKPAKQIVREQALSPEMIETRRATGKSRAGAQADGGNGTPSAPALHLQVTHGERVVDKASGATKLELVRYYATVAPLMLEHLAQRPVALVRAPAGVGGATFFQKHGDAERLPGIESLDPALDPGHGALLTVASGEGLLQAAQMNVMEFHTWNARADRIERPDRMTFDLDPGERVPFEKVLEGAELVHVLLRELGLPAFLKTSGGKGLHVVVPLKRLRDWGNTKAFSQAVVQHLAETIPKRFVAKSGPRNRVGKIFVDYLRNGRGATTVSAWSARARPGLGVSVPVAWSELPTITSGAHWHVGNIEARLRTGNAPWKAYDHSAVALGEAMRRLGYQPSHAT